jgi:putative endonuclease
MAKRGYTSTKQPWALVYQEGFDSKTDAIKREKFLNAQKSREFYLKLIAAVPGSSVD